MDSIEDKVIEIRQDLVNEVHKLALLIQHHQGLAQSLTNDLMRLIKLAHGIDLAEPGWKLADDCLIHVRPAQTPEDPPPTQ